MKAKVEIQDLTQWEYKTQFVERRNWDADMLYLNRLGEAGWEAIAFIQDDDSRCVYRVVLKRSL